MDDSGDTVDPRNMVPTSIALCGYDWTWDDNGTKRLNLSI